jgi:hypothetical protein
MTCLQTAEDQRASGKYLFWRATPLYMVTLSEYALLACRMSSGDKIKADRKQLMSRRQRWAGHPQRPDFSKYPGTGFPDPAQSTDGFGGDSYQGGGDNQVAAPAPEHQLLTRAQKVTS